MHLIAGTSTLRREVISKLLLDAIVKWNVLYFYIVRTKVIFIQSGTFALALHWSMDVLNVLRKS